MRRRRTNLAALGAGLAMLALVGCGALDTEFEEIELGELVKTGVADPNHHYRIAKPTFVAARKNTAIIRDGPLFLIAVGPDLKSALRTYKGPNVELGVRLMKSPRTHLVIERVFTKNAEIDLFEGVERFRFDFPYFTNDSEIPFEEFPMMSPLGVLESQPLLVFLSELEVVKQEPSEELTAGAPGAFHRWPKQVFTLEKEDARFLVTNVDVSTLLLLDWMAVEPKKFRGGIVVEGILDPGVRRETKVLGAVNVRWIDLGSGLFFKSRPNLTE